MPAGPKLATDPGRNCFLFRSLCSTALRYDDHDLAVFAARLNEGLSHPLSAGELGGIVQSVMRYRARWCFRGHQQGFMFRQRRRGHRGGVASGVARRRAVADRDRAILEELHAGRGVRAVARAFGVSDGTVRHVRDRVRNEANTGSTRF